MRRLLRSKKGFKITVTVIALLILALVLLIFTLLFKEASKKDTILAKEALEAITTDIVLNSFLQTPVFEGTLKAKDLTPAIGNQITNADLISWTCGKEADDRNFKVLETSINEYFNKHYPPESWTEKKTKKWHLALFYHSDNKEFPIRGITKFGTFEKNVNYYDFKMDYEKEEGATQIIPCLQKNVFVKVAFFLEGERSFMKDGFSGYG